MIKLEGLWLGGFLWIMLCCFLIQETLPSLHCVFNLSKIKFTNFYLLYLIMRMIGRFQKISIPYHGRLLGFPKGRGGPRLWISEGMGGIYDWISEGTGEFHRWDFWGRKCRVSSLKTLL